MKLVKVEIANLSGGALDWAVAKAEGLDVALTPPNYGNGTSLVYIVGTEPLYRPSTDWAQGGLLIERHAITIAPYSVDSAGRPTYWVAEPWGDCPLPIGGATALIAACRAIVIAKAKIGVDLKVPADLVEVVG
jgi:hypothetical protein